MKKFISLLCLIALFGMYSPALAVNVPANTSILISADELVTSKDTSIQTINAKIIDDVTVNGVTVFKSGGKVTIDVSEIEKARCWGKEGKITLNNGFAYDVNGNKHRIMLSRNIYGETKTWPKTCGVVSIFFLWPLALFGFVHGGQAQLNTNAQIETYLASQFEF